jgi:hypothetical protein
MSDDRPYPAIAGGRMNEAWKDFTTADKLKRVPKIHITETAARHGVMLCRQGCGTWVYITYVDDPDNPGQKKAVVMRANDDEKHECPVYKRAQMIGAKAGTIPMKRFERFFKELELTVESLEAQKQWTFSDMIQRLEADWPVILRNIRFIRAAINQQKLWNADFIEKNNEYEAKYKVQSNTGEQQ